MAFTFGLETQFKVTTHPLSTSTLNEVPVCAKKDWGGENVRPGYGFFKVVCYDLDL